MIILSITLDQGRNLIDEVTDGTKTVEEKEEVDYQVIGVQDPLVANERGKLVQAQAVPVDLRVVVPVVRAQVAVQVQVPIHQDLGQRIKRVCFQIRLKEHYYRWLFVKSRQYLLLCSVLI